MIDINDPHFRRTTSRYHRGIQSYAIKSPRKGVFTKNQEKKSIRHTFFQRNLEISHDFAMEPAMYPAFSWSKQQMLEISPKHVLESSQ